MDETLVKLIAAALERGAKLALATIIETKGSTPRKAGTAMVVWPDGRVAGTIGGGCSEAEVKLRALQALDDGRPARVEVRMLNDAAAEEGMVCGGIMQVFVQVIKTG
ncbi:MAG: XdhC family protein [Negativicutes bacterium]|nr:XdhC family protein [Negativicutes bacterium]